MTTVSWLMRSFCPHIHPPENAGRLCQLQLLSRLLRSAQLCRLADIVLCICHVCSWLHKLLLPLVLSFSCPSKPVMFLGNAWRNESNALVAAGAGGIRKCSYCSDYGAVWRDKLFKRSGNFAEMEMALPGGLSVWKWTIIGS